MTLSSRFTIVLHVTVHGDWDSAHDVAHEIEKLAVRLGGKDPMLEVLEQGERP
jgi:hypothetical protein